MGKGPFFDSFEKKIFDENSLSLEIPSHGGLGLYKIFKQSDEQNPILSIDVNTVVRLAVSCI